MTTGSKVYLNETFEGSKAGYVAGKMSKTRLFLIFLIAVVVGLAIGLLVGRFAICDEQEDERDGVFLPGVPSSLVSDANPDVSKKIMDAIDPMRIEENLRNFTRKPHIAGRSRDFELVALLQTRFREYGLHVQTTPYDVLLSYPSNETPNSLRLLDASGNVMYDAVRDESNMSKIDDVVPPYHGYSPNRLVEGQVVFAGYGRVEDYNWLKQQNINVTGHIVIVKYGKIFRGSKVDIAARHGAIGIIMYSDPADSTGLKMGDHRVYPETWWMPPSGAERGTIFTGDGDPLTPGYPATGTAYRYPEDEVDPPLPKIPSHPIGYGAAVNILRELSGMEVPTTSDWIGGLNITYRVGPGFLRPGWRAQLNVTTKNQRAKTENVFGIIKGTVEPDRYVLFGNHRDAWIYGAIDPSSGTAVMLEMARVMGGLVKSGEWKPRRSIMFCSWGAEEFGLVGSTEWVEHYVSTLRERVVGYVNVDIAVEGNDTIRVSSTPLMYNVIYEATKKVSNPNPSEVRAGRQTVYDTWMHVTPWTDSMGQSTGVPAIGSLSSGSDYGPLLQIAGITSVDLVYSYNRKIYDISSYALYHTEYEIFDVVKDQFDRNFEFHAAVGRVCGEVARVLSDSLILPLNVTQYALGLERNRQALHIDYGIQLRQHLDNYDALQGVIANFSVDVANFESALKSVDKNNPFALRRVNDQIMLLERAFLDPKGLPTRPLKKHLIFAENANDAYAGSSFPGLVDLLFEIEEDPGRWESVKQHFSVLLHAIQSAGASLRDVTNFMSETL